MTGHHTLTVRRLDPLIWAPGPAVVAYVIVKESNRGEHTDAEFAELLRAHVAKEIGAIARPRQIYVVSELPKTRSGKIMRRLLRDVAEGRPIGDTTTLADPAVMKLIEELSGSPATTSITTSLRRMPKQR